jgi:primosomal protein N'
MEIRDISRVITSKEILAPYQIALILDISAKYLIPIHRVLGFFLSKAVIKRLGKKNYEQLVLQSSNHQITQSTNHITILKESIITGEVLSTYMTE